MDYRVSFERIGNCYDVEPVVFEDVEDPDELAALIYERGKRYLPPNDADVAVDLAGVDVAVDLEDMSGDFYTSIGRFRIEKKAGS